MLPDRIRTDLREAMRSRDRVVVAALRSALAAVANAEAQPSPDGQGAMGMTSTSEHVAGSAIGVGATEVERKRLARDDVLAVLRREVEERRSAAQELRSAGRADRADEVDAEAEVLARYC
ncbi:MAG: GatB/YqeY domain-containing protein [Quadrisphaera sp.]